MFLSPVMDRPGTRTVTCRVFLSHAELSQPGKIFVFGDCRTHESICSLLKQVHIQIGSCCYQKMLPLFQCLSSVLVSVPVKDVLHEPLKNARGKLLSNHAERQKKNAKFRSNYNSQTLGEKNAIQQFQWETAYSTHENYIIIQGDFTVHCKSRQTLPEVLFSRGLSLMQSYNRASKT